MSTKKEGKKPSIEEGHEISNNKASSSTISNSLTSWTRLKDPRIVRVSRAFGGKDRHSKVCTIRGLRDRRVRLSVSTAIQLYDLQDRLGLNQPSKVVDWLLNAAKHEIDELPPLQFPPGNNFMNPNLYPMFGIGATPQIMKPKDVVATESAIEDQDGHGHNYHNNIIMPKSPSDEHQAYIPGHVNLNVNAVPFNTSNFLKWAPSNLSLSHDHHGGSVSQQHEDIHNFNVMSMPLGNSQVVVYPPQSFFHHPHSINAGGASSSEFDPKEINFQMSSVNSQNHLSRHFHFLPSQNSEGREPDPDSEFHSN